MGSRRGDLDLDALVYLVRERQFDAARLEPLVDHQSGLLGISGVGSDMRRLHEAASSNPDARLAIEIFCCAVRKQITGMIAALNGLDMLVLIGGIGESDAPVRAATCKGLKWIGVSLDAAGNRSATNPIKDAASRCSVRVQTGGARPSPPVDHQAGSRHGLRFAQRHCSFHLGLPTLATPSYKARQDAASSSLRVWRCPCLVRDATNEEKRNAR